MGGDYGRVSYYVRTKEGEVTFKSVKNPNTIQFYSEVGHKERGL